METTCPAPSPTTIDGLLNRRVLIEQPAQGFRVAVDTVLLAAAVPARVGDTVCDLGCGAGGALLCLAARVPGLRLTGVEIQPELAALCRSNLARNGFAGTVVTGDVTRLQPAAPVDRILINPPYHDAGRHAVSTDDSKRIANSGHDADFAGWLAAAAAALRPGGTLTLIHRYDRLAGLLAQLAPAFGGSVSLPIAPKISAPPKRVILHAFKGASTAPRTLPPFILHQPGGAYTEAAAAVLRHGRPLPFDDTVSPQ